MLGIYYLSNNNIRGNFKNEQVLIKNMSNDNDKLIILEKDTTISQFNSFYLKFSKTNTYLSITKDNNYLINTNKGIDKWIFEKPEKKQNFISVIREKKHNKFFYKNIETHEEYSNIYSGWGYENIFW
jgi:hypothetical protein